MPIELDDIAGLKEYLTGVVRRADHHADNVKEVVLPLVGAIVLFKNPDQKIEVLTRKGSTANVLWVHIGASRYAFSYDHTTKSISVKRGSVQGKVLENFTNSTSISEIMDAFERF